MRTKQALWHRARRLLGALTLSVAAASMAIAQEATPPPTTSPATQPGAARNGNGNGSTRPTTGPGTKIMMNFKDASIDAVLKHLSESAGYIIIKETATLEGRVTIDARMPVSPDEAVMLLNLVLRNNGLAAIPQEGRVLKTVSREKAKKLTTVYYGNKAEDIPNTEELRTQVIPIAGVDATRLWNDLSSMLSDMEVAANAGSNTLIITDSAAS